MQALKSVQSLKMSKVMKADLQVLFSAFFFGIGFLGQRTVSVHGLGAMTCNAFRFGLSTLLLVIFMPFLPSDFGKESSNDSDHEGGGNVPLVNKSDDEAEEEEATSKGSTRDVSTMFLNKLLGPYAAHIAQAKKTPWFWGVVLGVINFAGSGFQQWGLSRTTASKCAFIAGFDLFLTPIFSLFIPTFKRNAKPKPSTWIAVSTSLLGLYFLSGSRLDEFEVGFGETLIIISTVFWTLHITYTDIATGYVDAMSMMCIQLGVVTFLSALAASFTEPRQWTIGHILGFLPLLLFLAISEGLGFVLMALGQNFSPPTHAAIILSLEGVFAAIASYFVLGEVLSLREFLGCVLMLASTFIAKIGCGSYENQLNCCGLVDATSSSISTKEVSSTAVLKNIKLKSLKSSSGDGAEGDVESSIIPALQESSNGVGSVGSQ